MGYGIKVEVWGDYALFSRPEIKVERVSYDVITPSAARGLIEAIYWHPGMKWVIDRIYVCNPIKFTSVRRNEVSSKVSAQNMRAAMYGSNKELYINTQKDIQQRASLLLSDVRYVIEAHFEMTDKANQSDNPGKFTDIMKRRLKKGQCYHQPCLGCREFPANFQLFEGDIVETEYANEERDFGFMLYDMDYSNPEEIQPMFYRAVMKNGIIEVADREVFQ